MMKTIDDIDFDPKREICAAKKNNDSNHFIAYKKIRGGGYEKAEESVEISTYYGGADACQGDSGGPLQVDYINTTFLHES